MTFKVVSVVGIRPNFVKLAALHPMLSKRFDHLTVHTGQHYDYEMSKAFFEDLSIPDPDYNLGVGSGSHGYQLGEVVKRTEGILLKEAPELVVVYGDGNSTLGGALAAVKLHIPTAHVEAGYRSFDMSMPEEINRVLTDHSSNLLLAPTKSALENLKAEKVRGKVHQTGDVMVDVLLKYMVLARKTSPKLKELGQDPGDYILVTIHREKNTEKESLRRIVGAIASLRDYNFVFPMHPRTRKLLKSFGMIEKLEHASNIKITEPMNYLDFVNIEANASKILTDSGGVQKEAYVIGVPCITVRRNTELVETVREGWNVLVGDNPDAIRKSVREFLPRSRKKRVSLGKGDSAIRTSNILAEFVKRGR